MRTLVLASYNRHKVNEIKALLPDGYTLKTMAEAGFNDEIPETSDTIAGNSRLKADALRSFLVKNGDTSWVIADDSGLEVNALDGAPGVYSARYAGEKATDNDNVQKLLRDMEKITDRHARFVTVITLIADNSELFFEGEIKGTIAYGPRGKNGFGYDPVFIPTGYRSTFAELPPDEKNRISHRAEAIRRLIRYLERG